MSAEIKRFEKEFHDKLGVHYEQRWVSPARFTHHYKRIVRRIKFYLAARKSLLVDIGCGTGRGSLPFTDMCAQIIGIDISRSLLKIFKEKINSNHFSNIDLILCDAESLPLRSKTADVITFFGSLHHLPDKKGALMEAQRILKNKGIISISEPNKEATSLPWAMVSSIANLLRVLRIKRDVTVDTQKL